MRGERKGRRKETWKGWTLTITMFGTVRRQCFCVDSCVSRLVVCGQVVYLYRLRSTQPFILNWWISRVTTAGIRAETLPLPGGR